MLNRLVVRATPLLFVLLLAPGALAQTTTITAGETAVLKGADNGNGNMLLAQQATLTQAATLQSLSFYVTRAAGQLRLGVYDASGPGGGPGVKMAETSTFTPGRGWNTRAVVTPVLLPAGNYWLAYSPSSSRLAFRKQLTGSARYYWRSFGTMPTTFSTTPPTAETVHWSLYATLNPSSASPTTPTVILTSTPSSITTGQSTTLAWSSTDALSCAASGAWSGSQALSGQTTQSPSSTATYTLTCTGAGGSAAKSVTVTVASVPAPTLSLSADPTSVSPGQPFTLTWSSSNATDCTATGGWSGSQSLSGQLVVSTNSTATYTLTCVGAGGSVAKSVTVTVTGGATQLTLNWIDNAGGTAAFKVERRTGTTGTYTQIATTSAGAVQYVDATIVTGTPYCYRVRAWNVNGDSDYSNEACRTP